AVSRIETSVRHARFPRAACSREYRGYRRADGKVRETPQRSANDATASFPSFRPTPELFAAATEPVQPRPIPASCQHTRFLPAAGRPGGSC
ncbi:hypothetical protein HK405_010606, partial [Cladochytrium tenue]